MEQKMIFKRKFIFCCLGLLVLAGCVQKPVDVSIEISSVNDKFQEAYNNGDARAVAENYAEDAKLFPENTDVVQGKDAIEKFWAGAIGAGVNSVELETVSAEKYGYVAVEEGRYKLYGDDGQMIDQGKYIVIWDFSSGQWKIIKDIWNSSNPVAETQEMEKDSI